MSPMRSKTRDLLTLVVVVAGVVTPAARADVVDNYLVNHHPQAGAARTTAELPDLVERWVLAHTRRGAALRPAPDLVDRWIAARVRA